VIAIGDMSGDVFGNGLLRSRMTKLVGAFNHQHIFLDPDPDPETSFRYCESGAVAMRRSSPGSSQFTKQRSQLSMTRLPGPS